MAGESGVGPITVFDASGFATRIAAEVKDFNPEEAGRQEAFAPDGPLRAVRLCRHERGDRRCAAPGGPGVQGSGRRDHRQRYRRHSDLLVRSPRRPRRSAIGPRPRRSSFRCSWRTPRRRTSRWPSISAGRSFRSRARARRPTTRSRPRITAVANGDALAMITGGSEACISPLAVGGFCSMKAMSTRNDEPTRASRPFDKERDGFVLGEGSGVLIFEEYEHAKARGAKIYAEVLGYGQSADAYDLVAVDPERRRRGARVRTRVQIGGHFARTTSITSTRTAPRRRSAIRPNPRRSKKPSARTRKDRREFDQIDARPRARRARAVSKASRR